MDSKIIFLKTDFSSSQNYNYNWLFICPFWLDQPIMHFEQAGSTLGYTGIKVKWQLENLLWLWPHFLKVVKLSALRFLLHRHLLHWLEVLRCKVVEVVLQLPNLCLPHFYQGVLHKQSDQYVWTNHISKVIWPCRDFWHWLSKTRNWAEEKAKSWAAVDSYSSSTWSW